MKEKLLTENKSQRMLTGVMVALFFVLAVCTIFTGKYVPAEKGLTLWELERIQEQDDGTQIEVCLSACYPETAGCLNKFYVGTGNEIYATLLRQSMPVFIISMLTLMVGLFMIIENIFERFGKCYRIGGDEFCCIRIKRNSKDGINLYRQGVNI